MYRCLSLRTPLPLPLSVVIPHASRYIFRHGISRRSMNSTATEDR